MTQANANLDAEPITVTVRRKGDSKSFSVHGGVPVEEVFNEIVEDQYHRRGRTLTVDRRVLAQPAATAPAGP